MTLSLFSIFSNIKIIKFATQKLQSRIISSEYRGLLFAIV